MNKPLVGVRILDLTHMLAGPYAGMIWPIWGRRPLKLNPLLARELASYWQLTLKTH